MQNNNSSSRNSSSRSSLSDQRLWDPTELLRLRSSYHLQYWDYCRLCHQGQVSQWGSDRKASDCTKYESTSPGNNWEKSGWGLCPGRCFKFKCIRLNLLRK
jgi:hypothetical protein